MKKKVSDIWDETPFRLGKYKHKKSGKLAIARKSRDRDREWEIDKGKRRRHPFFRVTLPVYESGTGNFFFNKSLKDYEWIGELDEETVAHFEPKDI